MMKFKFWLLTILLLAAAIGNTQAILKDIPVEIQENSNIIIIDENLTFNLIDIKNSEEIYSKTYIVMRKNLRLYENIFFDEFTKIKKARVKIYDKNNKLIEKYNARDFRKQMMCDGSVAADNGVKYLMIPEFTPPYKVVFEYKTRQKYSLFYPKWKPVSRPNQYILKSELIVNDFTNNNLRYISYNTKKPIINQDDNKKVYTWSIKDFNNGKSIPFSRDEDYLPIVLLAPNNVYADGYAGRMSSWKSLGHFIKTLNEGRDNFTEEDKAEILDLVKDTKTDLEKVKIIYSYLQETTRYASIQLGIGGWRPFESSYTHKKKYGDCKGLSFYTQSMLDLIEVPSYYTLVRAGKFAKEIPENFPSMSFNHAFLMVPLESDTVWLECTSQTGPFGFSGFFTNDRKVLVVKDDGGHLVQTKIYTADENLTNYKVNIRLGLEGEAKMDINKTMMGLSIMDNDYFYYAIDSDDDRRKWIYDNLDIGNFKIDSLDFCPIKMDIIPEGQINLKLTKKNYGKIIGGNILVKPFIFNKIEDFNFIDEERFCPLYIDNAFLQRDEITIEVPNGYEVEKSLSDFKSETKFGTYIIEFAMNQSNITCTRYLKVNKGEYSVLEYSNLKAFFDTVIKKDSGVLMFKTKQP